MQPDRSILGLSSIRQNRGVSLAQISEATKIGVRTLQAIEEGDFKKLPGGIYNTSYIRQYARAIDFDEFELLAYYHSHNGSAVLNTSALNGGESAKGLGDLRSYATPNSHQA